MSKYPLHEKLKAHEREANILSAFLDMLDERGLWLGQYHTHTENCLDEDGDRDRDKCDLNEQTLYTMFTPRKEQLIGFYLDIDPKALSAEKDAMYAEIVAANKRAEVQP